MSYAEFPAGADLASVVELFWTFESQSQDIERIAPDGRCELIVHLGEPYLELGAGQAVPQPRALVAGQLTEPLHLRGQGHSQVLSARLMPAAAARVLHGDARQATNRRLDLQMLDPIAVGPLIHDLQRMPAMADRVGRLAAYLTERCRPVAPDLLVEQAVDRLEAETPPTLADLAAQLGLSPRQFERRFLRAVGIPARLHLSLVRFRRVFAALRGGATSLSGAAQIAGYSDHPQMAREFQRFLGCPARQFIAERAHARLAAAMTGAESMSH